MRILLTGASGFIGTNLLEDLISKEYEVLNIDLVEPKIPSRKNVWQKIDIRDYTAFERAVLDFNPDYIVHLAARTDLDGKTLEDYDSNIVGVENMLKIVQKLPDLKKIIITSSKFVTRNGYQIKNQHDYCPHTKYGESKVETEIRVWGNEPHCDWCIIRPTSIWGPWFGVPYRNFFDMVMRRMYFHIGHIKCHKTYGYVGNAIYQIEQLLFNETPDEKNKVFYIGDEPAYEINEWADEIAGELGFKVPTAPVWFVKCLAKFGDFLGLFGIHFPMQSFRYGNMTNDGTNDMSNTYVYAPENPYTRLETIIGMPEDIKESIGKLKYSSIQTEYFPDHLDTEAQWIYYPDPKLPYHRILVRHNFCPNSRGYWTETNSERVGMEEPNDNFKYMNQYAYPLNTIDKPEIMRKLLAWSEAQGVYGLGRWGEHQHYNSDVTVDLAMKLAEKTR